MNHLEMHVLRLISAILHHVSYAGIPKSSVRMQTAALVSMISHHHHQIPPINCETHRHHLWRPTVSTAGVVFRHLLRVFGHDRIMRIMTMSAASRALYQQHLPFHVPTVIAVLKMRVIQKTCYGKG